MANPSSSQDSTDKFVQGRVDEGLRAAEGIRDPELKARWIEWVKRFPDDVKKLDQAEASLKDLTAEIDKLQVRLDESRKKSARALPIIARVFLCSALLVLVFAVPPLLIGILTGESWFPPLTFERGSISLAETPSAFWMSMLILSIASAFAAAASVQLILYLRRAREIAPASSSKIALYVSVSVIIAAGSCVLAVGAYAAAFKWVDEQGVTHYGEKPPPGQKAQQVQVRPGAPSAAPASKDKESARTPLQDQERDFQQRRIERLEKEREEEKQQARARAEAQQIKERCIAARNNLEGLQKDVPAYRLDEKGGRQYIDDKKRAAEIARAKKDISAYCKS